MKYLIVGMDHLYNGRYGLCKWVCADCNYADAWKLARQFSEEVVQGSGEIQDALIEQATLWGANESISEYDLGRAIDRLYERLMKQDEFPNVWPLIPYTNIDELNQSNLEWDQIYKKWCQHD